MCRTEEWSQISDTLALLLLHELPLGTLTPWSRLEHTTTSADMLLHCGLLLVARCLPSISLLNYEIQDVFVDLCLLQEPFHRNLARGAIAATSLPQVLTHAVVAGDILVRHAARKG